MAVDFGSDDSKLAVFWAIGLAILLGLLIYASMTGVLNPPAQPNCETYADLPMSELPARCVRFY